MENKTAAHKKSCGEEHKNWSNVQFAAAGNYSVQLREGDEHFVCGMDEGLPDWMDRLKCCGNAAVPQIAAYLWRLIAEAGLDAHTPNVQ